MLVIDSRPRSVPIGCQAASPDAASGRPSLLGVRRFARAGILSAESAKLAAASPSLWRTG